MGNLQRLITNGELLGKRVEKEINLESWVRCPSEPPPTIPYLCPTKNWAWSFAGASTSRDSKTPIAIPKRQQPFRWPSQLPWKNPGGILETKTSIAAV